MISSRQEYDKAQEELRCLEDWLARLQHDHPFPTKGLTKAGVRKMISRLREELARFEGTRSLRQTALSTQTPNAKQTNFETGSRHLRKRCAKLGTTKKTPTMTLMKRAHVTLPVRIGRCMCWSVLEVVSVRLEAIRPSLRISDG